MGEPEVTQQQIKDIRNEFLREIESKGDAGKNQPVIIGGRIKKIVRYRCTSNRFGTSKNE